MIISDNKRIKVYNNTVDVISANKIIIVKGREIVLADSGNRDCLLYPLAYTLKPIYPATFEEVVLEGTIFNISTAVLGSRGTILYLGEDGVITTTSGKGSIIIGSVIEEDAVTGSIYFNVILPASENIDKLNNVEISSPVNGNILVYDEVNQIWENSNIIERTSTDAALRITQLGTGEALRVEDSTNPDSTPFIVDATGKVGIGTSSPSYFLSALSTTATDTIMHFDGGTAANANLVAAADTTIKIPAIVLTDRNNVYGINTSFYLGIDRASGPQYASRNDVILVQNFQDKGFYFVTNNGGSKAVRLAITGTGAVGIGTGTTAPAASSLLEMSSTTKGILIPRMTTTQRNAISSPAIGLLVYDTTLNAFYYYTGTAWSGIGGGGGGTWGSITGTLSDQTDLQDALDAKFNLEDINPICKLSENINKGQAVYISGATGTNMIASKASNDAESTSSKTFGLLSATGVTNDHIRVITNGFIKDIDTSTATIGDFVWLGTNGNLIFWHYPQTTKPVAPAHLVFLGIVTKVHAVNGEIFVKVQNGYEIEELHNVSAENPNNNDTLRYNSSTNLWEAGPVIVPAGMTWMGAFPG